LSSLMPSYPEHPDSASKDSVAQHSKPTIVTCEDRWQVYHRLQDLDIACCCGGFKPLQVQITTPTEAMQLWSVLRRVTLPRKALAASLQRCWQLSVS